ncbi:MAG: hypothetical protein GWP15_01110 [Nitrospirae bacterium]|nr:hypothetical protein [Nitrospirota bacterium]
MSEASSGKTDIGLAVKGLVTNNPEKVAIGTMGGKPSPIDKFINESRELQEQDPESVISKVKNNVIKALKTPTTLAKGVLDTVHGATKVITLQINKAIQQTVNLGAVALAVPVTLWEVGTSYPKAAIKKITNATHTAIDKVFGLLPTNEPQPTSSQS